MGGVEAQSGIEVDDPQIAGRARMSRRSCLRQGAESRQGAASRTPFSAAVNPDSGSAIAAISIVVTSAGAGLSARFGQAKYQEKRHGRFCSTASSGK